VPSAVECTQEEGQQKLKRNPSFIQIQSYGEIYSIHIDIVASQILVRGNKTTGSTSDAAFTRTIKLHAAILPSFARTLSVRKLAYFYSPGAQPDPAYNKTNREEARNRIQ